MLLKMCIAAVLASLSLVLPSPSGSLLPDGGGGSAASRPASRFLVAWSPENLPRGVEAALDDIRGVRATTVRTGLDWMTASHSATGKTLDNPPPGYGIPLEMAVIKPREYAHFVEPTDAHAVESLTGHHVLLSATEASLRGGGKGLRLSVGRKLRVSGVIANHSAQGYEGLIPAPVPPSWPNPTRFVLIRADRSVTKRRLRRVIQSRLVSGQHLRIHSQDQTRYLRFGDAVQPQLIIKRNFGEFSARRLGGGQLQIDERWLAAHIRTLPVPILGTITCDRKLFPQLRGALAEVRAKGLSHTIDPSHFAGCFNPSLIPTLPGAHLSHHSWGVALDINSSTNPYGAEPHQNPRLVAIMRRWGFTWGGSWIVPDGMHFEWIRFHT